MHKEKIKAAEAAQFVRNEFPGKPRLGILTGTGLGETLSALDVSARFDYEQLPHFPVSTVTSHSGKLLLGTLAGVETVAMQGRFHLYEGYSPKEVTFPVRVMQELGVEVLVLSNAAGGLNLSYEAGDIMVIADHINLTGDNPLKGPNADEWGLRFPDMIGAYDGRLAEAAMAAGRELGAGMQRGVYAGLTGPSLETPAEMRYLRIIGADAVGFSTVSEAIAGVHAGMKVLGLSTITNINDPDNPEPATLEGVIEVAEVAAPRLDGIIRKIAEGIAHDDTL